MLKTRYALCASRVIRDAEENRISAIDLLEDIAVAAFPIVIPRLSLVISVSREDGDAETYEGSISIRMNDEVLMTTPLQIDFQGGVATRATVVIGGLQLPAPGRFSVSWSVPDQNLENTYAVAISAHPQIAGGHVGQATMI